MKICIITPIFPPEIGGPAIYSYELAKRLKDRHSVRIVTWTDSPAHLDGVEIFRVPFGIFEPIKGNFPYRVLRFLNGWKNLFLYLARNRKHLDLMFVQCPDTLGFASVLFAKILRKPVVLKFVGDIAWETASSWGETTKLLDEFLESPEGGKRVRRRIKMQEFIFQHVVRIITPSSYLKTVIIKYYGVNPAKIRVIANAIELSDYEALSPQIDYGKPTLCTICRLAPWKGVKEIIEIMPQLLERHPAATLLIIGDDGLERQRLESLAQKTQVNDHVLFLGKREHGEAMAILQNCDLFVLNSGYEGLPHTVLEAMAAKVPVVATGIGGNSEVITNNETGWLVEVRNKQDLLDKIILALENKETRKKVAEKAYENVEDNFVWEKTLGQLESVLGEAI